MPRIVQHDVHGGRFPLSPDAVNNTLASSSDGQLIAARIQDSIVIVADCTGNLLYTIRRGNGIDCMTISLDNECLAIADSDGVHLLDLKTEQLQWSLLKKGGGYWRYHQIAFSPDGQLLASTDDLEITLWDLHTRRMSQVLRTGESDNRIRELDFSADGSRLRTNRGMWPLPGVSNSLSTIPADLVAIGEWVTWRMASVLWIPHHLFLSSTVAGNVVAFVSQSGLPIWIQFDLSKMPTDEALVTEFTWEDATDCKFEEVSKVQDCQDLIDGVNTSDGE
jgi:WD40 repeat protein